MIEARCPSCRAAIRLDADPVIGQRVNCPKCHTQLEVIWLYPVDLDWADENYTPVKTDFTKSSLEDK